MDFKTRLKELRESKGLTQKQFANNFNNYHLESKVGDKINVSTQTVSYWENGREPNFGTLIKLASFFDVTIDYLLGKSDISDKDEYNYISTIKELNKEKIDSILLDLTTDDKKKFFKNFSQYFYNLALSDAIFENRTLNKNELGYINLITEITSILRELDDNYIDLFVLIDRYDNVIKKQNLTLEDINTFNIIYDDALLKLNSKFIELKNFHLSKVAEWNPPNLNGE